MDEQGERYAWAAYFLAEMGKAVIDDVGLGLGKRDGEGGILS
jgi:hypothetical protein